MSECTTGCGRPTERMLCEQCLWEIRQALDPDAAHPDQSIPAMLDDLATTLTRQARLSQRNGKSKSAVQPVPFHVRASDIEAHARAVLTGWVRVLADDDPELYPVDRLDALAAWLLARLGDIAMHEAASEIHAEITDVAARIRYVIDRPADRLYAGICGTAFAEQHHCDEPLYAHPGASVVRCVDCGTAHEVTKRREDMLRRLDDRLVTAAEFAHLATYLIDDIKRSREQTRKLVNQWHKRGLLERKNQTGDPLFRFADAIAVLARDQARRDERALERQAVSA